MGFSDFEILPAPACAFDLGKSSVPCGRTKAHWLLYLIFLAVACSFPGRAHAACSSPAGTAGEILYNQDYHVHQYCNGTSWIAMADVAGDGGVGSTPTTSGLVGYWKLDDGGGTTANDDVGSNDGTLTNGPVWTTGRIGGAVEFDGTNDFIQLPTAGLPANNATQTLAAWFKYTVPQIPSRRILSLVNAGINSATMMGFECCVGWMSVVKYGGSGLLSYNTVAAVGAWHHYAYTFDGTNHALYLDGVMVASSTTAPNTATPTSGYIGQNGYSDAFFKGTIDDVRIYNRALSPSEIRQLYSYGQIAGGSGCLDPAGVEGNIVFNASERVPQYCEGNAWKSMGTCPAGGNANLIGRWKLDDTLGVTAVDNVTGGSNGTLVNGPVWTSGTNGKALDFDGTDDYVDVPSTVSLDIQTGKITLSAWINPDVTTGTRRILSMPTTEASGTEKYALLIDSNTLQFRIRTGSTDTSVSTAFTTTGGWTHVAGVYDGTTMNLYVNGSSVASTAKTGTVSARVSGNLQIGRYGPTSGQYFDGKLSDARVYGSALSDREIYALYQETQPSRFDYNKIGHWTLDASSGTSVRDETGVNTGTAVNGPVWSPSGGIVGGALEFDGVDDQVNLGSHSTVANIAPMTIVAWINPDTLGEASIGRIIGKTSGNTTASGWTFNLSPNNRLNFAVDHATTDLQRQSANNTIALGGWQQVAITWTGSTAAANAKLYINGLETTYAISTDAAGARVDDQTRPIFLGNPYLSSDCTFDGKIDDVRIYTRVLSPAEIWRLYDAQVSGGGCTAAGVFVYDSAKNLMKYCDGMRWNGFGVCLSEASGQWKFNETAGISATDSSGSGMTGTLTNGPVWSTGSLTFDGVDDYVVIPDVGQTQPAVALTLSAWINSTNVNANYAKIICKPYWTSAWSSPYSSWCLAASAATSGKPAFEMTVGGAISTLTANTVLSNNTWYHIVATYDGTTRKIYINGVLDKTSAFSGALDYNSGANTNMAIGARSPYSPGEYFPGKIDDVRIYKRTLSATEVANLYAGGRQ